MRILWKMRKSIPLCVCQSALRHATRRRGSLSEMVAFLWWIPLHGRHHSHTDNFQCVSRHFVGDGWPLTFGWGHPVQTGDDSRQREADTICACQALKCITLKTQHRTALLSGGLMRLIALVLTCWSFVGLFGKSSRFNSVLLFTWKTSEKFKAIHSTQKWITQHYNFYLFFHSCLPFRFLLPFKCHIWSKLLHKGWMYLTHMHFRKQQSSFDTLLDTVSQTFDSKCVLLSDIWKITYATFQMCGTFLNIRN